MEKNKEQVPTYIVFYEDEIYHESTCDMDGYDNFDDWIEYRSAYDIFSDRVEAIKFASEVDGTVYEIEKWHELRKTY